MKRFRLRRKEALLTAVIMAAAGVMMTAAYLFLHKTDSYTINGSAYYYFGPLKQEYKGDSIQLVTSDEGVLLKDDKGSHPIDSKPLYVRDENMLVIPAAYSFNDPMNQQLYRVEHFSEVKKENNSTTVMDGDRKREGARGFLHDGHDTYIFLESVTVEAGDQTIELSSLSYAVARYGKTLQYYDYDTDTNTVLDLGETDMTAKFHNGDYVNLGTDTLYMKNGTWQLLAVRPELLSRMD